MYVPTTLVVLISVTTVSRKNWKQKLPRDKTKKDVGSTIQFLGLAINIIICILSMSNNCLYTVLMLLLIHSNIKNYPLK